MQKIQVVYL